MSTPRLVTLLALTVAGLSACGGPQAGADAPPDTVASSSQALSGNHFWAGQTLLSGETAYSEDKLVYLKMQTNGNLELHFNPDYFDTLLWASNTSNNPGAYAKMLSNGQLCVISTTGTDLWCGGRPDITTITIEDTGFLGGSTSLGQLLWWSNSPSAPPASACFFPDPNSCFADVSTFCPAGTWWQSCNAAQVWNVFLWEDSQGTMTCLSPEVSCKTESGSYNPNNVWNDCNNHVVPTSCWNNNGILTCDKPIEQAPSGSFPSHC